MALSNPAYLALLPDPEQDETGATEIALGKAVGGEHNEARALVELGTALWTIGGRGTVSALRTYGEASAPAPFRTTSTASGGAYEEIAQIPLRLARGRTALGVDVIAQDLDIQLALFRADGSTAIGAAVNYTQAGLYEVQVAGLDATNTYLDPILKISVKKDAGAGGDGKLWGIRIVPDASPTTTDATAGFKGQDTATYTEDAPLDAFLLHGVAANLAAADAYRLPVGGSFWPDKISTSGVASRPVLWGHRALAFALGMLPIPEGATEISARIRATVTDAAVNASLALFDPLSGRLTTRTASTAISVTATPANTTLTAPAGGFGGRVALLLLIIESEGAGSPSKHTVTGGSNQVASQVLIENLTSITFSNTDRWRLYFDDTGTEPDAPFPASRAVVWGDTHDAYVWPLFESGDVNGFADDWADVQHDVYAESMGFLTLYGWEAWVSALEAPPSILGALRPALPAAAPAVRALYQRMRALSIERAPVFYSGTAYDPARIASGGQVRGLLGVDERFQSGGAWIDLGACTIGRYVPWSDDFGASTSYQADFVAVGLVACVGAREEGFPIDLEMRISHAGATSDTVTVPLILMGAPSRTRFETVQAWGYRGAGTGASPAHHLLRGAMVPEELGRMLQAGALAYFVIPHTDAGAPQDRRLLRLECQTPQVRADTGESLGERRLKDLSVHLVAWGVFAVGL